MVVLLANNSDCRLSPNLALLDANATGRTFAELKHTFLPVDFFDLWAAARWQDLNRFAM